MTNYDDERACTLAIGGRPGDRRTRRFTFSALALWGLVGAVALRRHQPSSAAICLALGVFSFYLALNDPHGQWQLEDSTPRL